MNLRHARSHTLARGAAIAASAGLVATLAINAGMPAFAQHVEPTPISGNPKCKVLFPSNPNIREFKLEGGNLKSGTYTSGDGLFTVRVTIYGDKKTFDWSSENGFGVDGVFAKAGPGGNFYLYDPPAEETSDTGLYGSTKNGLSHILFCYDVDPATATPTNTPTPENTPTATPTTTATPTNTPEPENTPTATPTNTPEPENTPTATPTNTPEPENTPTATPTNTPEPENTPTVTPTNTPEPENTPTNTPQPENTPTATPTNTPPPASNPSTATPTNTPAPSSPPPPPSSPPPPPPPPAVIAAEVATPTFTPEPTSTPEPVVAAAVATPEPTAVAGARLPRAGGLPAALFVMTAASGSALLVAGSLLRRRRPQ